jgi:hypothetical protein
MEKRFVVDNNQNFQIVALEKELEEIKVQQRRQQTHEAITLRARGFGVHLRNPELAGNAPSESQGFVIVYGEDGSVLARTDMTQRNRFWDPRIGMLESLVNEVLTRYPSPDDADNLFS